MSGAQASEAEAERNLRTSRATINPNLTNASLEDSQQWVEEAILDSEGSASALDNVQTPIPLVTGSQSEDPTQQPAAEIDQISSQLPGQPPSLDVTQGTLLSEASLRSDIANRKKHESCKKVQAFINSDPVPAAEHRQIYAVDNDHWKVNVPPFYLSIPSYKSSDGHINFRLVSMIRLHTDGPTDDEAVAFTESDIIGAYREIAVERRYTQFQQLHTILKKSLPLVSIPDVPPRRFKLDEKGLERRRRDLERFLRRLASHPLVRSERSFLEFLGNEDETVSSSLATCNISFTA